MRRIAIITGILFTGFVLASGQTKPADNEIADAVEDQFMFDHAVNVNKVDVEVSNGIAQLTGEVNNLKAKQRATKIAELVKGVRAVSNQIEVDPSAYMSDEVIKELVSEALLDDPATDLFEIGVTVEDGVVNLHGTVDSYQEKRLVTDVSASVKGVTGLKNEIDVNYNTTRTDYEIEKEIEAALKWDEMIDDGLLKVHVDNGDVDLTGSVASAAEKTNAMHTSWVAGVRSVDVSDVAVEWWLEDKDLRKNKNMQVTDAEIVQAIRDAAAYDPRVNAFDISAESELGWVTLRGDVNNLKAKKAAGMLAEHTYGVKGVTNRIKVRAEDMDDLDVQAEVDEALRENAVTESWDIGVFVHDGIATLAGKVDSYLEKVEAEWVTSNIDGINEVNNVIEVSYPYGYYWYGPYPYYDVHMNRPVAQYSTIPDDDRIKSRVSQEIWWSPYVDREQVDIEVDNGVVTLTGDVDSFREYKEAADNAWEGGALSVENDLVVK